jgi:hypothetical protein
MENKREHPQSHKDGEAQTLVDRIENRPASQEAAREADIRRTLDDHGKKAGSQPVIVPKFSWHLWAASGTVGPFTPGEAQVCFANRTRRACASEIVGTNTRHTVQGAATSTRLRPFRFAS